MIETIIAAAIRCKFSGVVYQAHIGGRHDDALKLMYDAGLRTNHSDKFQGFVTNTGRFVGRHEACFIARAANQIITKTGGPDQLYSEDVW